MHYYLSYKLWGCLTHNIALSILRIGNYQQIPNEIMTNQDKKKQKPYKYWSLFQFYSLHG